MTDREYFNGRCPYTDLTCLTNWDCHNCDVEEWERQAEDALDRAEQAEYKDLFGDYPDMPYQFDNMTGSMNLR